MKSTHRLAAPAAGFLALSLAAAPLMAQGGGGLGQQPAQRGGPPNPDTPKILITTFHSDDRKLGVEMAEDLRKRESQEHSAKELAVIQKKGIDATLLASGYQPDSALSASDLMELAKQMGGDIVIDGTVNKAGTNLKLAVRVLTKSGQATLAQPLPVTDAKDVGDASKQLEKAISESNKALVGFKSCKNNMTAAKYAEAATAARAGLTAYPNSAFSRVCLLQSLVAQKAAPDQIIEVANAIKTQDPTSQIAYSILADAQLAKGDTAHAMESLLQLWRNDRTNAPLAKSIIQMLASSGSPDVALPIVDTLLVNNPGDPEMLRIKWLLQLRANRYKNALVSGEEYVKADTAAANLDYYNRQIFAAQKDSNNAAMVQFATKAAAKFPTDPSFNVIVAQSQMKAGQLDAALASARKAQAADAKAVLPWVMALSIQNQLHQPDSALATAKSAIAAGVPKDSISQYMLAIVAPALRQAQASKSRADWEAALMAAQAVDAVAPTAQSSFYLGVSAFQIGMDALTNLSTLSKSKKKEDLAQACAEAKVVEDQFATVQIAMPKGGSVDAATAGTILQNVNQYGPMATQAKTALKCK